MIDKRLATLRLHGECSSQPMHERLREHPVDRMVTGRLRPGPRIPSEHRLTPTLGSEPFLFTL
jgi:DNA-binding transcriptional regulator YhcF (GntR family)